MALGKFQDLRTCADGAERAHQPFRAWAELWIFTGTRCNLHCDGCYTESSPRNASFRFITLEQTELFLREAHDLGIPKICYTGGEPFYNPHFPAILDLTIELGFQCLVLTNLTKPYEERQACGAHAPSAWPPAPAPRQSGPSGSCDSRAAEARSGHHSPISGSVQR